MDGGEKAAGGLEGAKAERDAVADGSNLKMTTENKSKREGGSRNSMRTHKPTTRWREIRRGRRAGRSGAVLSKMQTMQPNARNSATKPARNRLTHRKAIARG